MNSGRLDVIEVLEKEREYHLEQVKRINMALAALKGQVTKAEDNRPESRRIEWTTEIVRLFDTGEELDLEQVRQALANRGTPEALEPRFRNTVYTTLMRKVQDKTLTKTGRAYRKGGGASVEEAPQK